MQETVTFMLSTGHGSKPEPVEIPRRVGNVKLGEMLGEGAGGVVFVGFDEMLNRRVAVKLLHRRQGQLNEAALTELANGVRAAGRIKHPNIITVHSVESVNRMPVIVMEYIDGLSMRDVLLCTGALDLSMGLYMMRCVVSAVEALHNANVVHRDLKPANILFDRDGHAHVCDFGLACDFDTGRYQGVAQNIGGSPLYMAPEMFDGHVSPQSDVYALGVILFEVLTGATPFTAETISEMKVQHSNTSIPLSLLEKRRIPEEVIAIVERALHKQRILRYKTAAHMMRAIEGVVAPERNDETLRRRLSGVIAARQGDAKGKTVPSVIPSQAMTTFDLVAERARQKREAR
jgi:serine/threonine-protein kinase